MIVLFNCQIAALSSLGMLDEFIDFRGTMPRIEGLTTNWRSGVRHYVDNHAGQAAIVRTLDSADIVNREREQYVSEYCTSVGQSSLHMYRLLNPDHQLPPTSCTIYANRRLLSRLRCQCFGLQVDVGRFERTSRDHRVCQVCHAKVV